MKTLTLLRHAKSSWDDAVARDFDRPLNQRGRRAARIVGREMRAQALEFDQVIASPAVRVIETIAELSEGYGGPIRPVYDERIYLASASTLLDMVHEASDGADRLLMVGHSPGLESLALLLTGGQDEGHLQARLAEKYPTGTVAEIRLNAERWSDVAAGTGRLERFIRPRDLDPELGPEA